MKIKYDKLFAAVCLVACAVLYMSTGSIKDMASSSDPGARLFPYIGEGIMALCSVIILLSKSEGISYLDKSGWKKLLIIIGCMIIYAFGLKYLGFLISTPIMIMVFIYLLKEDNKVKPLFVILLAAVLTVGLYLLFTEVFSILLPKGKLF